MLAKTILTRSFATAHLGGTKVGFIGLGNMGLPMTVNLRKNGFEVKGYEIGEKQKKVAAEAGTQVVGTIKEAVEDADWIITALPKTQHVEKVLTDEADGIFEHAKKGAYIIDVSTISPQASADFHVEAAKRDLVFLDSPMSGGINGAAAGTLSFMVGGSEEQFEQAKKVLSGMGSNFFHCGKPGSGEIAKLVNNAMLGINMVATSEAMNFGEKLGVDPAVLREIMAVSTSSSWVVTSYNPRPNVMENVPASKNYEGGFGTSLLVKDLNLAIDAAKEGGALSEFTSAAAQYYEDVEKKGGANKDFSYVYQYISKGKKL